MGAYLVWFVTCWKYSLDFGIFCCLAKESEQVTDMNIEFIWKRIRMFEGETFYTKNGCPYSYHTTNRILVLENTNRNIPIGDFEKALAVEKPSVVGFQRLNLQGPSYIYGIITDPRIIK